MTYLKRNYILEPYYDYLIDRFSGGFNMNSVTVSSKYQVVIPRKIRAMMNIKPGQKVQVLSYEGRIELIPEKPIQDARGFLAGIKTDVIRESDRL